MNLSIRRLVNLMTLVIVLILASCTNGASSALKHKVTFYNFFDEVIVEELVLTGENAVAPSNIEIEGHTFVGWDKDFTNVTTDLTVKSIYEKKSYTLTFVVDGEIYQTQTVKYGLSGIKPTKPNKEGYTFIGWDDDYNLILEDTIISAIFEKDELVTYTVTFYNLFDQVIAEELVVSGSDAVAPGDMGLDGYTFIGWDQDFTNVTSDLAIRSIYERKSYTLTFLVDGEIYQTQTIEYGSGGLKPQSPVKEGYTFIRWDDDYHFISEDTTINAIFEKDELVTYTVTFYDDNGIDVLHTEEIQKGGKVTEIESPLKDNAVFSKWVVRSYSAAFDFDTEINQDYDLIAVYDEFTEFDLVKSSPDYYTVHGYLGTKTNVSIPSTYKGLPVAVIYSGAFEGSNFESVFIPNSIITIYPNAFKDSLSLSSVIFEDNSKITTIGYASFMGTINLTAIDIPNSVTDINQYAFKDSGLVELTFEEGSNLKRIGQHAFTNNLGITTITLPKSVTLIDHFAFKDLQNLVTFNIESNSELETINASAFENNYMLKSFHVPNKVKIIRGIAFQNARSLQSLTFEENSSLEIIGNDAFRDAAWGSLSSGLDLLIPKSVVEIQERAFRGTRVNSLVFEDGSSITTIGYDAFYNSKNIGTLVIPKTLTEISAGTFQFGGVRNLSFENNSSVEFIRKSAFYSNILDSITIPASVKFIGESAFRSSGLVSVYFEQDSLLETIEHRAFSDNDLLRYFVLPGTVTTMGTHVFLYTKKEETLIIYVTILNNNHPDWPTGWQPNNTHINWASDWSYNEEGLPQRNND